MARVQVVLDIEEADLKLFQNSEGVALPTNVVKIRHIGNNVYRFQHAANPDAAKRAIRYQRSQTGKYPPSQFGRSMLTW